MKKIIIFCILEVTEERSRIRDTVPRIRIQTKNVTDPKHTAANCRCSGADPGWIAAPSDWILGGDERRREQQRQLGTSQGEHLQLRLRTGNIS